MLATRASRLPVLPTAAVPTNGNGTPVSVNLVSEQSGDARLRKGTRCIFSEMKCDIISLSNVQPCLRDGVGLTFPSGKIV